MKRMTTKELNILLNKETVSILASDMYESFWIFLNSKFKDTFDALKTEMYTDLLLSINDKYFYILLFYDTSYTHYKHTRIVYFDRLDSKQIKFDKSIKYDDETKFYCRYDNIFWVPCSHMYSLTEQEAATYLLSTL